ncbi:unnamed protein product [Allacma fusca]|uniref:Uncharacterized protein n=1 Tax=Allacma fusca TaxID=39272 RepID=A0A8J2JVG9_9HEXA|nr:unnamed protein product [Allacma fusca]
MFENPSDPERRKLSAVVDESRDDSTSSDSETSSSEDEAASNVSLDRGLNPCKCCMCEECDLRSHCIVIGLIEMIFWPVFLVIMFLVGLLSRGSEPAIYTNNSTEPVYGRNKKLHLVTTAATAMPVGSQGAGRQLRPRPLIPEKPIESGWNTVGSAQNSNSSSATSTSYEFILRSQIGDAVLLFKPNTEEGIRDWELHVNRLYLVLIGLFATTVVLSMLSGLVGFNGAYYRNKCSLLIHSVMAFLTGVSVLGVGGVLAIMHAFTSFVMCSLIFCTYIYFAVCSYGLVTVIRAGAYDDFMVDGVTYTYSTILRAKVGVDEQGNTVHPNWH